MKLHLGYIFAFCFISATVVYNSISKGTDPGHKAFIQNNIANKPFALMEIFTSEGCSSCPPAYKVTDELVEMGREKNENIWVLDFHVDYLNGLGWVDSFSKNQYTLRQQDYDQKFPDAGMYTPQMIVNGKYELLASDSNVASKTINKALKMAPACGIHVINVRKMENDSLEVQYSGANIPVGYIINFALVQHEAISKIIRGENRGKTLNHHNVVRILKTIPSQTPDGKLVLGGFTVSDVRNFSVYAYVQRPDNQIVLAADKFDMGQ